MYERSYSARWGKVEDGMVEVATVVLASHEAGHCAVLVFMEAANLAVSIVPCCRATTWPRPVHRTSAREVRRPVAAPALVAKGTNMPRENRPRVSVLQI